PPAGPDAEAGGGVAASRPRGVGRGGGRSGDLGPFGRGAGGGAAAEQRRPRCGGQGTGSDEGGASGGAGGERGRRGPPAPRRGGGVLEALFKGLDPEAALYDLGLQMVERLNAVATTLGAYDGCEPVVRARLLHALGSVYLGVGETDKARRALEQALEASREHR